ncbi:small ribosomal subunit protein uS15m [Petromyzon marinus]|uniref:Small ribosomal subunit protein uS15m n=1 Tax=Petromyzon marinus TaxID=7757 RepID=A0AAJ7XCJ0_PETMA|nr:28S ribosomal protein S15, mitochondrial [Petromyzon marinus]
MQTQLPPRVPLFLSVLPGLAGSQGLPGVPGRLGPHRRLLLLPPGLAASPAGVSSWARLLAHPQQPPAGASGGTATPRVNWAAQAKRLYGRKRQAAPRVVPTSQLDDLPPTATKYGFEGLSELQTADECVRRLLSLELGSHSDKLKLKKQQYIALVQRSPEDRSSTEVQIAVLTARIRNYSEHLAQHPRDKTNKRYMLMASDRRKKLLKYLRRTRYDRFEHTCTALNISFQLPPAYHRRASHRWVAKKALVVRVRQLVNERRYRARQEARAQAEQAVQAVQAVQAAPPCEGSG